MIVFFKITLLVLFAVFVVFISDQRRKPSTEPLIGRGIIFVTKICYWAPASVFTYSIIIARHITTLDWISLSIAVVGTLFTVKSKIDLGEYHTWAGYYRPGATRVTSGLYRYFRHPMYVGIITVIVAGYIFAVPRLPIWITVTTTVVNLWIVSFLILAARRETRLLSAVHDGAEEESIANNMPGPEK